MKYILTSLTLITILTIGSFASAKTSSNLYVGGSIGLSNSGYAYQGYDSSGMGFAVSGGYKFDNYWSFEGRYTHFTDATKSGASNISTNSFAALAKITLPLKVQNLSIFSKVGIANVADSGNSHLGWVFSYGLDLPLKSNLTAEVGYTVYPGYYGNQLSDPKAIPNADYYSVGIIYFLSGTASQK